MNDNDHINRLVALQSRGITGALRLLAILAFGTAAMVAVVLLAGCTVQVGPDHWPEFEAWREAKKEQG